MAVLRGMLYGFSVRRLMLRIPGLEAVRAHRTAAARRSFLSARAPTARVTDDLATALNRRGVVQIEPEILATLLLPEQRASLGAFIEALASGWRWRPAGAVLEADEVCTLFPDLYRIGLSQSLREVAESAIGQPCYFAACTIKCERPDGKEAGTRWWHLDIEDERMLRMLVYLNDVHDDGGPFEHLPIEATARYRAESGYRKGYVVDEALLDKLPAAAIRKCTGAAGSAVLFDGTRVLHRAGRPERHERFSICFTFTSRKPTHLFRTGRLRPQTRRRLMAGLSAEERGFVPASRLF